MDIFLAVIVSVAKALIASAMGIQLIKFLITYGGGAGFSILAIAAIIVFWWLPTKDRVGAISGDAEKGDDTNPLYLKGMFRKRTYTKMDNLFTADLKGDWVSQIHAVILIIVLIIYGIYSVFHGFRRFRNVETILLVWMLVAFFMHCFVLIYYAGIFDKSYIANPRSQWRPFSFTGNRRRSVIPQETGFTSFEDLNREVYRSCIGLGYNLVDRKEGDDKKIWIFTKQEKYSTKIFEIIKISLLEQEDITELDELFSDFFEELLKREHKYKTYYFIFLLCVDEETRTFGRIMNNSIIQGRKRYRLPVGITLYNGKMQIPCPDYEQDDRAYEKMLKEIWGIMKIED